MAGGAYGRVEPVDAPRADYLGDLVRVEAAGRLLGLDEPVGKGDQALAGRQQHLGVLEVRIPGDAQERPRWVQRALVCSPTISAGDDQRWRSGPCPLRRHGGR